MLERLLVEAGERRVERVLDDARVAPGRARGDRLALVEDDTLAPRLGEERGERAADDPAADDREVGRALTSQLAQPARRGGELRRACSTLATSRARIAERDQLELAGASRASVARSDASAASASRSTGSCDGS